MKEVTKVINMTITIIDDSEIESDKKAAMEKLEGEFKSKLGVDDVRIKKIQEFVKETK